MPDEMYLDERAVGTPAVVLPARPHRPRQITPAYEQRFLVSAFEFRRSTEPMFCQLSRQRASIEVNEAARKSPYYVKLSCRDWWTLASGISIREFGHDPSPAMVSGRGALSPGDFRSKSAQRPGHCEPNRI